MATAARKARKRAGIKFEKAPKEGTPFNLRQSYSGPVPGAPGTKYEGTFQPRSAKKRKKIRDARLVTA